MTRAVPRGFPLTILVPSLVEAARRCAKSFGVETVLVHER
jgi:hypothetical protein